MEKNPSNRHICSPLEKNNVQSPKAIEINPYIKPIDAKRIYPAHKLSVSS